VLIYDNDNAATIYTTGELEETAGDWSTSVTHTFRAPAGCTSIKISLYDRAAAASGLTMYFDEVSLYHLRACTTDMANDCFDGWYRNSTSIDAYRISDNDVALSNGALYGMMVIDCSAAADILYYPSNYNDKDFWVKKFAGKTVTFGCYVNTTDTSVGTLAIYDGSYHYKGPAGTGAWEWVEYTYPISSSATDVRFGFLLNGSIGDYAYISHPMLAFADGLGEGNFSYPHGREIFFEGTVLSNLFNGLTGQSDTGFTTLNIDADTNGAIPQGTGSIWIDTRINDSGSAANAVFFLLVGPSNEDGYRHQIGGLANDMQGVKNGWQPLDESGDVRYYIDASGANTFDMQFLYYRGLRLK
jgi:hypothetical protein